MEEAQGVASAGAERGAHVGGLHVLLVGVAEARSGVELLTVQPELVLVCGRGVDDCMLDVAWGRSNVVAQIRVLLEPGVGRTGTQPLRLPVALAKSRDETRRARDGSSIHRAVAGRDGEVICGVGVRARPRVCDERLARLDSTSPESHTVVSTGGDDEPVSGLDRTSCADRRPPTRSSCRRGRRRPERSRRSC